MKALRSRDGFTFVELLIAVSLVAILATICLFQYTTYRQKTYNSAAVTDLANANITLAAYFADNLRYP